MSGPDKRASDTWPDNSPASLFVLNCMVWPIVKMERLKLHARAWWRGETVEAVEAADDVELSRRIDEDMARWEAVREDLRRIKTPEDRLSEKLDVVLAELHEIRSKLNA